MFPSTNICKENMIFLRGVKIKVEQIKMPCAIPSKEIENLYRESLEDIQFLKQQQWKVVYYCLLLFSAIYIVFERENGVDLKIFFSIIVVLTSLFGLYFQIQFQNGMKKNRMRITYIRLSYPDWETLTLLDFNDKNRIKSYCCFWKDGPFFISFFLSIVVASGFVLYIIWRDFHIAFTISIALGAVSSVWAD